MKPTARKGKKPVSFTFTSNNKPSRREVLVGSATAGAMVVLHGERPAAADGKKTFTILHTDGGRPLIIDNKRCCKRSRGCFPPRQYTCELQISVLVQE